jgi:putrescine aminotransferase
VGDRMVTSPPLVITREEIDILIERATRALDEAYAAAKAEGLVH